MPKLSQKTIFIISGITFFLVIAILFVFFYNDSQNKWVNSSNSSQSSSSNNSNSSANSNSNSNFQSSNSQNSSFDSNQNSLQTSVFDSSVSPILNNSTISVQDQKTISNPTENKTNTMQSTISNNPRNSSNLQTYTNPSYPNLKINYDDSWKMERSNNKAGLPESDTNLLNGSLKLSKGDTVLSFSFMVPTLLGCGGLGIFNKNVGQLNRYQGYNKGGTEETNKQSTHYGYHDTGEGCGILSITTNIDKSELTKYDIERLSRLNGIWENNKLKYWLAVTMGSSNPEHIAQADEIIKNSILE